MLVAIWDDETIEHVALNDITPDEVDHVLAHFEDRTVSRTTGRPIVFGYTEAGRYIAVVFEEIDELNVLPITAYEVE
jgi:uncharacterized DUF497 family protein